MLPASVKDAEETLTRLDTISGMLPLARLLSVLILAVSANSQGGGELITTNHPNGQVASRGYVSEDDAKTKVGAWVYFYKDGQIKRRGSYLEGQKHGTWTHFYADGQVSTETNYERGKKHGLFHAYYPNGNKFREQTFRDGQKDGPFTIWNGPGKKYQEGAFKNGKLNGPFTKWNTDGVKTTEVVYEAGEVVAIAGLEELVLPRTKSHDPDDAPPQNRVVLNVLQNGAVAYRGELKYDPSTGGDRSRHRSEQIRDVLTEIRMAGLTHRTLTLVKKEVGRSTTLVVDEPVLIRADKWTAWDHVEEVIRQCSQPRLAFIKVQLAVSAQDREAVDANANQAGVAAPAFAKLFEGKLSHFLPAPRKGTAEERGDLTIKLLLLDAGTRDFSQSGGEGLNPQSGRPRRFRVRNHKVCWEVGPTTVHTLEKLHAELRRVAADPSSMSAAEDTGGHRLRACRIIPASGNYYDDVAKTYATALEAGFVKAYVDVEEEVIVVAPPEPPSDRRRASKRKK